MGLFGVNDMLIWGNHFKQIFLMIFLQFYHGWSNAVGYPLADGRGKTVNELISTVNRKMKENLFLIFRASSAAVSVR